MPASSAPSDRPDVRLLQAHEKRLVGGHPWVYSNDLRMDAPIRAIAPVTLVRLRDHTGRAVAVATFNPHSLIAARALDRSADAAIDATWLRARFEAALRLRERFFAAPYYRLVHAEADGLPGLVVDRYGDVLAIQCNTAGMDRLAPAIVDAASDLLRPRATVLRNDASVRRLEGLEPTVALASGRLDQPAFVEEGGVRFECDLLAGQKTGWFFDLAEARGLVARLASGARVLDVYCHTGAFALTAAAAGASHVTAVDRSEPAVALAQRNAGLNGLQDRTDFVVADAFADLERRRDRAERYDLVVCDPPNFVKTRREFASGVKGYRKLVRLAAPLVGPGGFLFVASCSHHVPAADFGAEIARGLQAAERSGRIVRSGGAAPDHPVHPHLPESAYIKWQILQLD